MRGIVVLGLALIAAGPSPAQTPPNSAAQGPIQAPPPPRPSFITNPDWETKPDGESLSNLYPAYAADKGVGGHTLIRCKVAADGAVVNCAVRQEKPLGYGFGGAAVQASRFFRMRPRTIAGVPVAGGVVDVPLTWALEHPRRHDIVVETPKVVTAPVADREPEADYAEAVQANGEQGAVWVRAKLDSTGATHAISVRDSSHSPALDQAAAKALADWRFTPARNAAGKPMAATIAVKFVFETIDLRSVTCAGLTAHVAWVAKAWPERTLADFSLYRDSRAYASTYYRQWLKYGGEAAFDQRFAAAFAQARADCAAKPGAKYVEVLGDAFKEPPG